MNRVHVNWQLHSAKKKIDFEILELDDNLIGAEGALSVSDMLQHITEAAPPVW